MNYRINTIFVLLMSMLAPIEIWAGTVILNSKQPIQKQLCSKRTVYEIRSDIDLKGESLVIPYCSTLKFEGGALKNGTIKYDDTFIEGRYVIHCVCNGTIANDIVDPRMYGARCDGKTDDSHAIQQCVDSKKQVVFHRSTYLIEKPIVFDNQNFIVDFNFSTIKKTSKTGYNYQYEEYNFNQVPAVIIVKPHKDNTSGHIVLKNLIVEGGKVNVGIHAIWCRNLILENVRIFWATQGLVYGGFTNTFKDLTIWDSTEGFVVKDAIATLFERCFTSNCGWTINNSKGVSMVGCSSDDYNPCYEISNSSVSMVGCTFESKGVGMIVKNSTLDVSGDFETHVYDSTKELVYIKASDNSRIVARACIFHLNNYLKKRVPVSKCFEVFDNSDLSINGKVIHGNDFSVKIKNNSCIVLNGDTLKDGKKYYN